MSDEWFSVEKKPVQVQAKGPFYDETVVNTLEGQFSVDEEYAEAGFYIIKGVEGETYPCTKDVYEATYTPVRGNYDLPGEVIYVAGPYSGETPERIEQNVQNAVEAGVTLMELGHYPLVPHLTHYLDRVAKERGIGFEYEDWMLLDESHLKRCDSLFLIDESPGANQEVELAHELNMDVYEQMSEVP